MSIVGYGAQKLCPAAFAVALAVSFVLATMAGVTYEQPPMGTSTIYQSAWWDPDDSDYDQYVWDNFTLPSDQVITEVRWRGAFLYNQQWSGPVLWFSISFCRSAAANTEPDVINPPLAEYIVDGNANQTPAGSVGGVQFYDYSVTLPTPFAASANTKYWIQIEAAHHGIPEWGFAQGSGGNGSHFRGARGSTRMNYAHIPGDCVFKLFNAQTVIPGDMNCDGVVSVSDIGAFVLALTDPAAYPLQFPACEITAGDLNADGAVSVGDIGLFVALLVGP